MQNTKHKADIHDNGEFPFPPHGGNTHISLRIYALMDFNATLYVTVFLAFIMLHNLKIFIICVCARARACDVSVCN